MNEGKITNTVRTGSLEEIQAAIDSENKAAAQKINFETVLAAGADEPLGAIDLPPPTIGSVMLLDLIESPFIRGGEGISMRDIMAALYILVMREKAANTIFSSLRAERLYSGLRDSAEKSPDFFAAHLQQIPRIAKMGAEFDEAMATFADSIGPINPAEVVATIKEHLAASMGGFEMLPSNNDPAGESKKN